MPTQRPLRADSFVWSAHALALAAAVCLGANGWPAQAQDIGSRSPPGTVAQSEVDRINGQLKTATARIVELEKVIGVRDADLSKALARATQAERNLKDAANRPAGASPEQLEALKAAASAAQRERDTARERIAELEPQLRGARDDLAKAKTAQGGNSTELRRLEGELAEAKRQTAALRSQLNEVTGPRNAEQAAARKLAADLDAARAQVAELTRQLAATQAARTAAATPTIAIPVPVQAAANMPPDLSELSVPGCGADCPSFILIPSLGRVTLGKGNEAITADIRHRFAMGKTEVTVRQWKAFWNASDRDYQPQQTDTTYCQWQDEAQSDDVPVVCVSADDAEAYARWFARRHGAELGVAVESIGLPSELEWELSARGGRLTQDYLWDDDADACRHAQVSWCGGRTKPVGARLPNGYRLYDMIGNALEWTASPWRANRTAIPVNGRDTAGGSASRVSRGASFNDYDYWRRLSDRNNNSHGSRFFIIGVRLVARIAP